MSQAQKAIVSLLSQATRTDSPEQLDRIAAELDRYSQYDDAVLVRAKARQKERELADKDVWRRKVYP